MDLRDFIKKCEEEGELTKFTDHRGEGSSVKTRFELGSMPASLNGSW
jgi:hypothetical protein